MVLFFGAGGCATRMVVLIRIWKSCRGYGSPAEDKEVLSRAWKSCREHGSPVESMEVLSRAWKSCKHGSAVEKRFYRQKKTLAAQGFYYLGTPIRYFDELYLEDIFFNEKSFFFTNFKDISIGNNFDFKKRLFDIFLSHFGYAVFKFSHIYILNSVSVNNRSY